MKTKLLFAILLLQSIILTAQPGGIDLSFNPTGVGAYGGTLPPAYQSTANGLVYKSRIYPSGPNQGKFVIVGRFTSFNGVPRKYVARISNNGIIDNTFNSPPFSDGYLYCVQILADGKILVGGVFNLNSGGSTIRNIARLNSDGSVDHTFNTSASTIRGTNGEVHALTVLDDGKILIGGVFTQFNGAGSKRLIRLNVDGSLDTTFNGIGTVSGEVRAIAIQRLGGNVNKIIVGGFFNGFGSTIKNKVLRLLPNGDYDPTFNAGGAGATGGDAVFDLSVKSDDQILVVGKFNQYNGVNKRSIVQLTAEGNLATDFNTVGIGVTNPESNIGLGAGYNIFCIIPQPNGELLIGGNFTEYNGTPIPKGLARLNIDGSLDNTFLTGSGFTGGTNVYQGKSVVRDIIMQPDGKIIVSGDFTDYDSTPRRMLARIKTRNCSETATYDNIEGWKDGISPYDSHYYTIIESGVCTIPTGVHLVACELEIKPGAQLVIMKDASITVNGTIINNGQFTVESSGSLVQVSNTITNSGSGTFIMKRETTPVTKFDFTYWSSPVFQPTLFNVSPNTLADKYFKYNTAISNWQTIFNGSENMQSGKGYIIRAPQTFSVTVPSIYTASFVGAPNNGTIQIPIVHAGSNWNLLGNPYPSSIDADLFLKDPLNSALGGTIYLWTHNTEIASNGSGQFVYTANDYATYNATGGVSTEPSGFTAFHGKIASGQAFFVEGLTNGTATFTNSMRMTNKNEQFYRPSLKPEGINSGQNFSKSRIWLNIIKSGGAFNQMLLGYVEGATNQFDRNYDGKLLSGNYVTLYSICEEKQYTIQARALPWVETDKVPLGYKTTLAGTLQIELSNFDGLFGAKNIVLEDRLLNVIHNLKNGPYSFKSDIGTFNNRFILRYTFNNNEMATAVSLQKSSVSTLVNQNSIKLESDNQMISHISVFDTSGKLLYDQGNVNKASFEISGFLPKKQLLLVKLTMQNNEIIVSKIIF